MFPSHSGLFWFFRAGPAKVQTTGQGYANRGDGRLEAAGETLICQSQVVPSPGGCAGGWEVLGSAQVSREKSKQELTSHVHQWEKIQGSPAPQAGGSWIKSPLLSALLSLEHSCPWDCSCQCFYCGMPLSSSEMVSLGSSHAKCSPAQQAPLVFSNLRE